MEDEQPSGNFDWKLLMYFVKIIRTVFIGLFWMLINIFFGLYLGFAIPEESTPARMTGFYIWFGLSLGGYIFFLWKSWSKKEPRPDEE